MRIATLIITLAFYMNTVVSAQRPEIVRHEMTGTIEVMFGTDEANRLRADLTQSIVNSGHHTVSQQTLCGTWPDGVLDSSSYDWNMDEQVKNAEGQAQQLSPIKDPAYNEIGQLVSYQYRVLFRSNDSTAVGHTQISYGPDGRWIEVRGDSADPSEYFFRADYDLGGRLIRIASNSRDFDYENKTWAETTSSWENVLGYDPAGRLVYVSHISVINGWQRVNSVTTNTFNDDGLVTLIEHYSDQATYNCGGEKVEAPYHRLQNGMYKYREDRYIYR